MTRYQAHPSEQTVGRIRNDGGWDKRFRRYRIQAEPKPIGWRDLPLRWWVARFGEAAVLIACLGSLIFVSAVLAVVSA